MIMEYIAHRRMKEIAADGNPANIPYGTKCQTYKNAIITPEGRAICYTTSENGHKYFSRNDDGKGLERGAYTYAIAYSQRERMSNDGSHRQRFTDAEIEILCDKWSEYIVPDIPVILFNHKFFEADVDVLKQIAEDVHIKVKEVQQCTK